MDQATSLVAELQQKLAELDQKVWSYRREMTAEFNKYAESLLRDVPDNVSAKVNNAIASSLRAYPSLLPRDLDADRSAGGAADNEIADDKDKIATASSGPKLLIMPGRESEPPPEVPRSPHEREKEFQGLFTPSYLPLLDSTDRNERRSSSETRLPSSTEPRPIDNVIRSKSDDVTVPTVNSFDESRLPRPPTPRRKNTDEASINSDHSDGHPRRSALRRSSSGAKPIQSPRRVRFEFAGKEFPTTSSPMPEPTQLEEIPSLPLRSPMDSDEEAGSEQVEYIDQVEESPPPRRISSSQMLRALSRGPIEDDGTQWTEVRAPPDGSASMEGVQDSDDSEDEYLGMGSSKGKAVPQSNGQAPNLETYTLSAATQSNGTPTQPLGEDYEDFSIEESDVLSEMAPLAPMKSASSKSYSTILSPEDVSNKLSDKTQTTTTAPRKSEKPLLPTFDDSLAAKVQLKADDDDDDDDLFDFDETPKRSGSKFGPESDPESESISEPESPVDDDNLSKYATSPARPILKPGSLSSTSRPPLSATTNNTGSYSRNPHPFATPIVSEDIHAQAASLGPINTFVGSVNGTSGLDESDILSYRATGGPNGVMGSSGMGSFLGSLPGGQPRSFSERMAIEEMMAEQESQSRGMQ